MCDVSDSSIDSDLSYNHLRKAKADTSGPLSSAIDLTANKDEQVFKTADFSEKVPGVRHYELVEERQKKVLFLTNVPKLLNQAFPKNFEVEERLQRKSQRKIAVLYNPRMFIFFVLCGDKV